MYTWHQLLRVSTRSAGRGSCQCGFWPFAVSFAARPQSPRRGYCFARPNTKACANPVQQVSKKLSPKLGIKKSSDRGHLPVVIRKAGLNGPPGLGKSGRDPFQLWSINRRPQARPASPYLVRARSAYLGPRSANFSSKPERGRSFGDIASDGEVRASSRDLLCSADLFQWGCGPFAVGSARRAISAPSVLPSSPVKNSSASRSLAGRSAGYEWYGALPFNLEQR